MALKVHQIVTIYEDPVTQRKVEGKAILLHKVSDLGNGLEIWKVCFEGGDGAVYECSIKAETKS